MRPSRAATAAISIAVSALCLLATVLFGAPARAADPTYPPVVCATLAVSTTTPYQGQTITVTGQNFDPRASIRLELHSTPTLLATVTVKGDGTFSQDVVIPAGFADGKNHLILAVGGQTTTCPADPIQVRISAGVEATSAGGGGLAFTGTRIATFLAVALALVGAGALLTRAGRRARGGHRV